ncbi:MAG TPA: 1-acyl-sn-glycerol-3-phosphate acyltransferase, partial [Gemmatimonadaceae bacterium]|nr:1-acyl-sn-glycerol-3-phosphate acyltransferase [Gemmatimonadaceae bacterium]
VIRHAVAGVSHSPTVEQCRDATQRFFGTNRVDEPPDVRYLGPRGARFAVANFLYHRLPIAVAGLRSRAKKRRAEKRSARLSYLNNEFTSFTTRTFNFRTSLPLDAAYDAVAFTETICRGVYRHLFGRDESAWVLAGRARTAHDADLQWAMRRPHGNFWIRAASWMVTKVLRRSVDAVTVDVPSFERALRGTPNGVAIVLTPSHRSYLDFVLTTYLAFARPDLLPIPHIAATMEFARIPILGRILESMHAFYLRRGQGTTDPELAPRVDALIKQGKTLAFFIEGGRSRSGDFLQPKRGLLRCLQSTGRTCALLPIAITYERVPEHETFARELAGHPKAKMRLSALVSWTIDAWRGRIDLGRVHIACGPPVLLDESSDVHVVSHDVIRRLREAMLGTTVSLPLQARQRGETRVPPSTANRRVKAAR